MNRFRDAKRIVVKVGTSTITYETGQMNLRQMESLCRTLSDIKNSGREIVLVTSAAIAVGFAKLGLPGRPADIPGRQATAAVGQCELMYMYDKLFSEHHQKVAQLLLTKDIVENPKGMQNVINTMNKLLEMGAIPIVNENDTVATDEIEFGDNDTLSAVVAVLCGADALVILSDIDGLYDDDPRRNRDAQIIPVVTDIDDRIHAIAGGAGSNRGTGGMSTKIQAANIAMQNGIDMAIINGADPSLLYDVVDGKQVGTFFLKKSV